VEIAGMAMQEEHQEEEADDGDLDLVVGVDSVVMVVVEHMTVPIMTRL
jgi:hypothetical protein